MQKNAVRLFLTIFLSLAVLSNSVILAVETGEIEKTPVEISNSNEIAIEENANDAEVFNGYEDSFPTIIAGSVTGSTGETIEIPIKIKAVQHITAGGITFAYDQNLECLECIPNGIYITTSSVDNGKISVTFMADTVKDNEVDVCVLKFKIPSNFEKNEAYLTLDKVNSLYSEGEFIGFYRNENSTITVKHAKFFDARKIAIAIDVIIAAILIKIIVSKIKQKIRLKKKYKRDI